MRKAVIVFVYGIIKSLVMAEANSTGNAAFVGNITQAFTAIEQAVKDIGIVIGTTNATSK